jgi:hypothetical protein
MTHQYRLFISDVRPEPAINPSNALVMGIGNSTSRAQANAAGRNFLSFYFENYATSGDNRGMYLRQYLSGAGASGEALRVFSTVNNVAAATVHGAHTSLNFGTTGTVTGQGIASRNTLHLPNAALASNVTLSALQAEIYCDGSDSDPGDATLLSFLRFSLDGHADGIADVITSTKSVFFDLQGVAAGGDGVNGLFRTVAPTTLGASLKVLIGSTLYYLPLYTTQS